MFKLCLDKLFCEKNSTVQGKGKAQLSGQRDSSDELG